MISRMAAANHFARIIAAIRDMDPSVIVEVLVPDFHAQDWCIQIVLDAVPDIYNHNMETVERLTPLVRSRAKYRTSLQVLKRAKELSSRTAGIATKSGIMLGLGETESELFQTMGDLREVGCEVLTLGQYLRPTPKHLPVVEYIPPRAIRLLRRNRTQKGISSRRLRSAGSQLLSRGRFSAGSAVTGIMNWTDAGKESQTFWHDLSNSLGCFASLNMTRETERSTIAAVIPAFNEGKHIGDVVRRTRAKLDRVLVVDDGSSDGTAAEAQTAGAQVIVHPENRGKGEAIRTGLRHWLATEGSSGVGQNRQFNWLLLLDADAQHRPEEIDGFIETARASDAKMIIGNRMDDVSRMPLVRRIVNRYMSKRISRLCGQDIPDTQCGFRMLHRELIPEMLAGADRFDYETEMLIKASRNGYRIDSVPITTVYCDEVSSIHPVRDTLRFFKLMRRYRRS